MTRGGVQSASSPRFVRVCVCMRACVQVLNLPEQHGHVPKNLHDVRGFRAVSDNNERNTLKGRHNSTVVAADHPMCYRERMTEYIVTRAVPRRAVKHGVLGASSPHCNLT